MLNPCRRYRARGFSLVELMVAAGLGLLVVSAVAALFANTVRAHTALLKGTRLEHELEAVLNVMTGDLRRAGHWAMAQRTLDGAAVNRYAGFAISGACVLYAYDEERDDPDGAPDAADHAGFRLRNGQVQMKTSDEGCGGTLCTDCATGQWWAISDGRTVAVTALEFSADAAPAGAAPVTVRRIAITLRGALAADPSVARSAHASVTIRNDRVE